VSKAVARYQNYVHIEVCLARRYIPRAWRKIKMAFIPVPILRLRHNVLFLLQNIMQKLVIRNIHGWNIGVYPIRW